ncbi:GntR family transcriptional regulator [Microbacterium sp. NPDC079995]|uniref:GntR family transcriptional regulator n=1 Tax=unclassified Microbacterium TaxID=2609290 RepID=UPI003450B9EC
MTTAHGTVSRRSSEPLYVQVAGDLEGQIRSGNRPPGSPLPAEQALQEIYGVSRSVVRQALDQLAQRKLISREQGRGTIVLPFDHYRRQAQRAGGLRQQIAALGGELSTRIVSLDVEDAPPNIAAVLSDDKAWRLERVRSVDGEPVIHMITRLPFSRVPKLSRERLNGGSLHDWLRANGVMPQGGPRHLHAAAASDVTADFLRVERGSPVTVLEGETRDTSGQAIEVFTAWHHPRTVFDLDAEVTQSDEASRAEALLREIKSILAT